MSIPTPAQLAASLNRAPNTLRASQASVRPLSAAARADIDRAEEPPETPSDRVPVHQHA